MTDDTWTWVSAFLVVMLGMAWVVGMIARRAERKHGQDTVEFIVGTEFPSNEFDLVGCSACARHTWVRKERRVGSTVRVLCPTCKAALDTPAASPVAPPAASSVAPSVATPQAPSVPPSAAPPLRVGFWARRRAKARHLDELRKVGRAVRVRAESAESHRRMVRERADLQARWDIWDDAEAERIRLDLRDDLRRIYPDASDAALDRIVAEFKVRVRDLPLKEAGQ